MRPVHRVFVTGATGFVGRAVVQALRGEGYVVRCLVRRGSEPDLRGVGAIERVEGDVLAPQLLDEGMAGCGAVIHLVGIIREHIATNTTFYRVHVQGTVNVVAAAAAAGVRRYVHMSALGARVATRTLQALPYFPLTPDQLLMLDEDNVCDPASLPAAFGLEPLPLATGLRRLLG